MEPTGNQSKNPDKEVLGQKPPGQKSSDNKPARIIEEIIAKYAIDTTLFRLGSTNPKKKIQPLIFYTGGFCSKAFVPGFFVGGLLT